MIEQQSHPYLDPYVERWGLIPDGEPIVTRSSRLLPVLLGAEPAMLKVAVHAEERWGARLMVWWDGVGAARVLKQEDDAVLLERAMGGRSLSDMAHKGQDSEASRILCEVIATLHKPRMASPPKLIPLSRWFRSLEPMALRERGVFVPCASIARELLEYPREIVALHGDVHHGNVLDFGTRGWLAIDPKGLAGERGFDYANLFCNPDHGIALARGRLAEQVGVVAACAGLEHRRLLMWVAAWAGLSAAWSIEDGEGDAAPMLEVAKLAIAGMNWR